MKMEANFVQDTLSQFQKEKKSNFATLWRILFFSTHPWILNACFVLKEMISFVLLAGLAYLSDDQIQGPFWYLLFI